MSDRVGGSYWSKRRRVLANVESHLAEIAYETELSASAVTDNVLFEINSTDSNHSVLPCSEYGVSSLGHSYANQNIRSCSDAQCEPLTGCEIDSDSSNNSSEDIFQSDDELGLSDECLGFELARWAINNNISNSSVNDLLHILRPFHPTLPRDSRTLNATPRTIDVTEFQNGEYHHVGIKNCLQNLVNKGSLDMNKVTNDVISIQVNIDGLPLFKSSSMQLWPILGKLKQPIDSEPFMIGVFAGTGKPQDVNEYLKEFVDEVTQLEMSGVMLCDRSVMVCLHSFVCDAPARGFLKKIKSFTGYSGCERCSQTGKYLGGRMTFPEVSAHRRTNEEFINMSDEDHHLSTDPSPLTVLSSIGMVSSFVLDYMHLVCLGVVRRLLIFWIRGPLLVRLPANSVKEISRQMLLLRSSVPCEFSRRPRSLSEIDRWKATEFRQFVLFTGPQVLKKVLPLSLYNHFLLLHVAMTCLISQKLSARMCEFARKLLINFVQYGSDAYGREFVVYNVHNLIHLPDDVEKFGCLDNISCFPFENYLGQLKKAVRKPALPLQQVVKRVCEQQHLLSPVPSAALSAQYPIMKNAVATCLDDNECHKFTTACLQNCTLSTKERDNCVLMKDGKIGRIQYFEKKSSKVMIAVKLFQNYESFYNYPLCSKDVEIVSVSLLSAVEQIYEFSHVQHKCYCMPTDDDKYFVVPLHNVPVHTKDL
jgi:hypothetical protein